MKSAGTDLENTNGNEGISDVNNIDSKSLKQQLQQINKDSRLNNTDILEDQLLSNQFIANKDKNSSDNSDLCNTSENDKMQLSLNKEDSLSFKKIINNSIKKDNYLTNSTVGEYNSVEVNSCPDLKLNLNDTDDHHKYVNDI